MKTEITKNSFVAANLFLLRETFEGSPENQPSAYLDRGVGVFSTLENLSAAQASQAVNETTVAAQIAHAAFYLERLCEFMNGRTEKVDWAESWRTTIVTETEWQNLRADVRRTYENVARHLTEFDDWNEDNIGATIGLLTHTAYHLGAIRQIIKAVK